MNFKSLSLLLLFGLASCQEMMEGGEGSGSGSGGNNGGSGGSGGEMGEGGSDGGNDGSDDGKGEMDDYSGYNCTDNWEEQGCNNYAEWNGTIVVTTSSYNLRWLCYGCEWKKGFRTLFPGAEIYVTLDADCDSTDDVTSTDGGNDGSGENGGSGGESGGGSGGSGGSGGEGGEGSDSGKGEGGEETTVTRRRLLTDTVTDSDTDSETIWENTNTASSYTITIEVAAIFYDCQALDALSTTFSDLAAEISDESEFMGLSDVTIQCSELDCCEDDDVCSPFKYCDTDGDGNYDTYDTDGDGVNDAQGNDSGANNSYDVMFSFVACIFALMSLVY